MLGAGGKERFRGGETATKASKLKPKATPAGSNERVHKRTPELEAAFGARIRAARVAASMSQGALGDAIGVSFQQIQKYEFGKDRVAASTLLTIALALGVHPGSFYDDGMQESLRSVADVRATMDVGSRIRRVRKPELMKRLMALVDLLAEPDVGGS